MKVGVVLGMSFPGAVEGGEPFLEALQKIAEDEFFDLVEIASLKEEAIRKRARELIGSSRLQVGFSGAATLLPGKYNLNAFEEEKRNEAVKVALSAYDEAREMGARFFSLISGPNPADRRAEAMRPLIQSLKEICDYARSRGEMPILLETFDCEIDKCCLIGPSPDALEIANVVAKEYPKFSLMLDLSHLPLLGEKPAESVRLLAGHIGHIHLGNCVLSDRSHPAYGDSHPPFGLAAGENDVEEVADFFRALLEVGYLREDLRPWVSLEVKPRPGQDPDAVLAGSKRVMKEAWARA
jgi:sugar phosphate isomerase/epimerase